jgi:hypothetical protein
MPETGLKTAIDAAGGPGEAPAGAEQLSLLQRPAAAPGAPADGPRGAGRPSGSRNKRTLEWQRWFEATGEMPLAFLAKTFRQDTAQLAQQLGCDQIEALKVQRDAAVACLPYVEQRLPLAVEDVSEGKRPIIVVGQMSQGQRSQAQSRFGFKLAGGDGRGQQNQGVIDVTPNKSDGTQSDADANPQTCNGKS